MGAGIGRRTGVALGLAVALTAAGIVLLWAVYRPGMQSDAPLIGGIWSFGLGALAALGLGAGGGAGLARGLRARTLAWRSGLALLAALGLLAVDLGAGLWLLAAWGAARGG